MKWHIDPSKLITNNKSYIHISYDDVYETMTIARYYDGERYGRQAYYFNLQSKPSCQITFLEWGEDPEYSDWDDADIQFI